jgi:hypothetical protein
VFHSRLCSPFAAAVSIADEARVTAAANYRTRDPRAGKFPDRVLRAAEHRAECPMWQYFCVNFFIGISEGKNEGASVSRLIGRRPNGNEGSYVVTSSCRSRSNLVRILDDARFHRIYHIIKKTSREEILSLIILIAEMPRQHLLYKNQIVQLDRCKFLNWNC